MMRPTDLLWSAAMAGLLVAGPAAAQQDRQVLSADEVKAYFESAEQEMTKAVRAGEYERLLEWTKANFADGATIFMSQESYFGDERKSFTVMSVDKEDMLKLGQFALGGAAMSGMTIEDYKLEIEVTEVDPIGPNAATAKARMTESGRLARSPQASAGDQGSRTSGKEGAQAPRPDPVRFEATAECSHLIRRGEPGGPLLIGLTACEGRSRF